MGTSTSSSGAPSGVPMVPPWVPDPPSADGGDGRNGESPDQQSPGKPGASQAVPIAPAGRFRPARSSLGRFSRSHSMDDMRRGVGHYVAKGLGGAGTATRRFAGTARTAGRLYGTLSSAAAGQAVEAASPIDTTLLAGRTASEVMNAVVEAVRPTDGTQDAEASRGAIRDALSELLDRFPDADLLNLSEGERIFAIERYVAVDVYNRFNLDVGRAIQDKAPDVVSAMQRLREIKDYIKEAVSAAFRRVVNSQALDARRMASLAGQAIREALRVFEDYLP